MLRIPAILIAGLSMLVTACELGPGGLQVAIGVDTLGISSRLSADQYLRLAVWTGPQMPENGDNPARIFHRGENEDSQISLRTLDTLCLPDLEDPTIYDCSTGLSVRRGTNVWIGAFFEYYGRDDGIPDPGEYLTVTGPIVIIDPGERIEGIQLQIVDSEAPLIPKIGTVLNDLEDILIAGDAAAFDLLIHPFFASHWNLDFDELAEWVVGDFRNGPAQFTNPLSAPLAGLLSPDVRDALDIKGIEFADLDVISAAVAVVDLTYVLRETSAQAPFTVRESWRIETQPAFEERAISRIDITHQNFDEVRFKAAQYDEGGLLADWSDSTIQPEEYIVGLDVFDPDAHTWQAVTEDVSVAGDTTTCGFNSELGICNNATDIETPDDLFYRIRVAPFSDGVTGRTSSTFVAGPAYLP